MSLFVGVVETGLFVNMATVVIFGLEDGSIKIKKRWKQKRMLRVVAA